MKGEKINDILKDMKTKISDIGENFDKYEDNDIYNSFIAKNTVELLESLKAYDKVKEDFSKEYYCCKCICCYCCCLKKKYRNDHNIKHKLKTINELDDQLDDKLDIIIKKENEYTDFDSPLILFFGLILSFSHFFAISEVYSVKFALFREIKKSIYVYFKERYHPNEKKTFDDYYRYSILRDISQTNISYITSFLTPLLVASFGAWFVYLISIIFIFLIMISISFIEFKDQNQINDGENYDGYIFGVIVLSFIGIYFFAGIICLVPVYILENLKYKYLLFSAILCSLITFSVILKLYLHSTFEFSLRTCSLLFLSSFIFLFFLIVKRLVMYNKQNNRVSKNNKNQINSINDSFSSSNNDNDIIKINETKLLEDIDYQEIHNENSKEKNNEKEKYTSCFILGYLIVKFENLLLCIKIRGFSKYISKFIFDKNLLFLLLINFLSRAQKLKFKFDYKEMLETMSEDEHPENYIIINFLVNCYLGIFLMYIFEKDNDKNIENNIIKCIIFDNIFILISSILCLFNFIDVKCIEWISIIAIAISGNVNYLFYTFYSNQKKNYISLSAFFAISTLLLRLCELIGGPFQNYFFQIILALVGILFSFIYLRKNSKTKIIKNKIFYYLLISLFLLYFIIPIIFFRSKIESKEKENIIEEENIKYQIIEKQIHYYCYEAADCTIESDSGNTKYPFEREGNYSICVYGPKAKNGGRGGKICGKNFFSNDSMLKFEFGGREAGGEGGKGCGFWGGGNGHNGAGYTMAYLHDESFTVIAGGGGGNSESGEAGGDAEKNGKGDFYGRGATKYSGGNGGDPNSKKEKGSKLRGGSGESKDKRGKYCGGGGGSGYYGGGAGDWGDKGHDGGGGGGSNYCKAQNCTSSEINYDTEYSCVEIIEIIKKRIK